VVFFRKKPRKKPGPGGGAAARQLVVLEVGNGGESSADSELANTQSLIKAKEKQRDSFMDKLETATDTMAVIYAKRADELGAELLILYRLLPSAAP